MRSGSRLLRSTVHAHAPLSIMLNSYVIQKAVLLHMLAASIPQQSDTSICSSVSATVHFQALEVYLLLDWPQKPVKALGHDFKRCLNQANLNFKRMKSFKDWTLEMGSIQKKNDRNLCCRKWAGVLFYSFLLVKCCWVASRCCLQAEMWTGLQRAVGKMKDENFF